MKKILSSNFIITGLLTASTALAGGPEYIVPVVNYFDGFYVGGTGALHDANFNSSSNVFYPNAIPLTETGVISNLPSNSFATDNASGYALDGYGGVQGGFGKVFNQHWYLGITGFGEWGSQSSSSTSASFSGMQVSSATALYTASPTSTTTAKIENDYGVAGKLGYLVAPRTMVYAKIGAIWADLKVSTAYANTTHTSIIDNNTDAVVLDIIANATGSSNAEQNKVSLLLGAGFEQFVYRNLISINVEGNYANYGTVKTPSNRLTVQGVASGAAVDNPPVAIGPMTTTATIDGSTRAIVLSLLGGINFYFGSQWF